MGWKDELEAKLTEMRMVDPGNLDPSELEFEERDEVELPEEYRRSSKIDDLIDGLAQCIEPHIKPGVMVDPVSVNQGGFSISIRFFGDSDTENQNALLEISRFVNLHSDKVFLSLEMGTTRLRTWLSHFGDEIVKQLDHNEKYRSKVTEKVNMISLTPFKDHFLKMEVKKVYDDVIEEIISDLKIDIASSIARYLYTGGAFYVFRDAESKGSEKPVESLLLNEFGGLPKWFKE